MCMAKYAFFVVARAVGYAPTSNRFPTDADSPTYRIRK